MTLRSCIDCGTLTENTRCAEHSRAATPRKSSSTARGYDSRWRRLSERARKLSPVCEDCGTGEDLTTDHSPEAWRRRARGQSIRLADVAVVCRSCNAKRGQARPAPEVHQHALRWGGTPSRRGPRPAPGAKSESHSRFSDTGPVIL